MKKNLVALSKVYDMWHKRVLSLLLAVVMIIGMIPVVSLPVSAATSPQTINETKVLERIEELKTKLNGKYFTENGIACIADAVDKSNGYHGKCTEYNIDNCKNTRVIAASWFKNLMGTENIPTNISNVPGIGVTPTAWTCAGFANYAMWYIFHTNNTDIVTVTEIYDDVTLTQDIISKLKPGDGIRTPGHSFIFVNSNYYFDCNGDGAGLSNPSRISFYNKSVYNRFGNVKVSIYRANNYDVSGGSTPTPPPTPNHSCGSCVSINKTGSVTGIVNIRTAPNTSSTVICEFPTGTSVTITAKCGNWYLVKNSGGTIGWAHANYIKVKESTSSGHECSSCVSVNKSGTVKSDVNVRSGPGTSYTFLFEYYTGTDLSISMECNGWYFVSDAGGNSGWVNGNFVKVDSTHYHDYVWNYEAAHPHREYVKCSCGDYEYTGENYFDKIYSTENEYAHPHNEYKICGICGQTEYTGATRYVDSCTTCNPPHTHSYTAYHEGVHPHREYMKCSCGDYYYLDSYYYDSSCTTCNPPHTHSYTTYHDATHPHREYKKCSCGDSYYLDSYYYDSSCINCTSFTVKFDGNGATSGSMSDAVFKAGQSATLPANTFSKTGYSFSLWSTIYFATLEEAEQYSKTHGIIEFVRLDQDYVSNLATAGETVTLYALWKPNTYKVKYNANGGSGSMSNSTHTYDTAKALTANAFTRSGYTFLGWSTNSSATTPTYTDKQSVKNLTPQNGDTVNLYAVWSATPKYTISYNANGGTGAPASQTKTKDIALTLSSTMPTRTGYTFRGWSTSQNGTIAYFGGETYTANSSITLYAVWKANTYTIKYNANGGSGSMANSSHTYDTSEALSANAFKRSGYSFIGWSTSSSATSATYTDKQSVKNLASENGDIVNLYAVWHAISYQIVYDGNGATSGTPTSTSHMYDVEKNLQKNTFKKVGYYFLGWSTDKESKNADYIDEQAVKNLSTELGDVVYLYAIWSEAPKYIVSYDANGGIGKPESQSKVHDEKLLLSDIIPEKQGYLFIYWSGSDGWLYKPASEYRTNSSVTMTAVWNPITYTVKYNANGGSGTMSNSSHTYDIEKTLPVNAFTRSGYTFLGWSTDPSATSATYTDKQSVKNLTFKNGATVPLYAVWKSDFITGKCGDNLNWKLDENGVLHISGTGPMYDAKGLKGDLWSDYKDKITKVIIYEGVTSIGYSAFSSHHNLISVSIADSVQYIGDHAFYWCDNLKSVNLPEGITTIEKYTFNKCKNLTSIYIPNTVTKICYDAFDSCYKLSEVTLSENLKVIEKDAFRLCDSLKSIELNNGLETIGEEAFSQSGLQSITIPASVKNIGKNAFDYCSDIESVHITDLVAWCSIDFANEDANPLSSNSAQLYVNNELATDINFHAGITIIGNYAFNGCGSITSVTIPDSAITIGDYAFAYCNNLSTITIPDSVTSIGEGTFDAYLGRTGPTIYGYKSSFAYKYAISNSIPFVAIDNVSVSSISLNKTSTTLTVGDTETLTATVTPNNATNKAVTWTSSNSSVATVSNGVVTATAEGTATITVKTADGNKTATCTVTVEAANITFDAYVYTEAKKTVVQGTQFTYKVYLAGTYDGYSFAIIPENGLNIIDITPANSSIYVDELSDKWLISILGGLGKSDSTKEEIVTVTIQVDTSAQLGTRSLSLSNVMISSDSGDKVSNVKYEYANIEITDQIPGDINGDGTFDYYDVSKLFAVFRGKSTIESSVDTDINDDGTFDYYDVSKLFAIHRGKATFN